MSSHVPSDRWPIWKLDVSASVQGFDMPTSAVASEITLHERALRTILTEYFGKYFADYLYPPPVEVAAKLTPMAMRGDNADACQVTHAPSQYYICWTHQLFLKWSVPFNPKPGCSCDSSMWLTSADPEPPPGTMVKTADGAEWWHDHSTPHSWLNMDEDNPEPESWTKVAGNYGPVWIVHTPPLDTSHPIG